MKASVPNGKEKLCQSFHSRLRDEFLALEEFGSLAAAQKLTRQW